ncbi:MAG: HAD-IA family hydrolase [Methylobacter sp.]|uniref:HAD-IA family hydrolase n=1 Tax=Candidatus Methylobacter titanis TaxID=3053457 RepID=A0AA43Q6K0_9GAMM|nr:HAD-IA family hydrolase [Candidatus Methylobacter titanis]MDI1291888.1 HAD-IA family hydrolase [Candidatus Methylobacter titanis]
MTADFKLSCVLFDLDGTLVDTAPDLISCLNRALHVHGFDIVVPEIIKPFISYGAAAMINASQPTLDDQLKADILETMLTHYQNNIAEHTVFFSGMAETLAAIEAQGLKWGVVTNKRKRFTNPLMDALKLTERAACIVSGDTTANPKPHPEPMLLACKQADVNPKECVYIGDALHDITAGKNAQMKTLAAVYGYINPGDTPETWGADALIESPAQISTWIAKLSCR